MIGSRGEDMTAAVGVTIWPGNGIPSSSWLCGAAKSCGSVELGNVVGSRALAGRSADEVVSVERTG
jgi:hypothetical protein